MSINITVDVNTLAAASSIKGYVDNIRREVVNNPDTAAGHVTGLNGFLYQIVAKPQGTLSKLKERIGGKLLESRRSQKLTTRVSKAAYSHESFKTGVQNLIIQLDNLKERGLGPLVLDAQTALDESIEALSSDDSNGFICPMTTAILAVEGLLGKIGTSDAKLTVAEELLSETKKLLKEFLQETIDTVMEIARYTRKIALTGLSSFMGIETVRKVFAKYKNAADTGATAKKGTPESVIYTNTTSKTDVVVSDAQSSANLTANGSVVLNIPVNASNVNPTEDSDTAEDTNTTSKTDAVVSNAQSSASLTANGSVVLNIPVNASNANPTEDSDTAEDTNTTSKTDVTVNSDSNVQSDSNPAEDSETVEDTNTISRTDVAENSDSNVQSDSNSMMTRLKRIFNPKQTW
ncbi:MAG: hypothetical protein LBS87_02860 [Puniceicoccales bacterium]|jgi:hypothetical protein|nr:hypothetical protein [Puniceicoccales bacterium]